MTTARAADLRRIEAEVGVLIRRVKRVVADRARAIHPDLQAVTYFILNYVIEEGPLRASDLADSFGMDKGGVSRQVQHLTDLGLVTRERDPDDRRAQLLAATPQAITLTQEMSRARSARFDDRLAGWSDEDLADFATRLADYNKSLADD